MRKRKRGGSVWKCRKAKCQEEENWQVICKQLCLPCLLYCQHSTTLPWCILYLLWSTAAGVLGFIFYLLWNVLQWIGPNRSKGTTRMSCPQYTSPLSSQKPLLYPKLRKIRLIVFTFFRLTVGFLWSYPTSPIEIRGFVLQLFYLLPFLQFHQFRHRHHHRPRHHLNYHHRHHQHDHVDDYQSHERFALQISDKNFLVVSRQVSQPGWADLIGYAKPVIFASKSKTAIFTLPIKLTKCFHYKTFSINHCYKSYWCILYKSAEENVRIHHEIMLCPLCCSFGITAGRKNWIA